VALTLTGKNQMMAIFTNMISIIQLMKL
ncbi:uncharacterized protein METZ01_LOCUS43196, partial [marine metagenome]